jgi:hypothetical protein
MTPYLGSLQQRQPQTPRDGNHAGEFQKDRVWSIERSIGEEYSSQLIADGFLLGSMLLEEERGLTTVPELHVPPIPEPTLGTQRGRELKKGLLLRLSCYGADADAPSVHSPHRGTPVLTLPIFDAPAHDHARPVPDDAVRHP